MKQKKALFLQDNMFKLQVKRKKNEAKTEKTNNQ